MKFIFLLFIEIVSIPAKMFTMYSMQKEQFYVKKRVKKIDTRIEGGKFQQIPVQNIIE